MPTTYYAAVHPKTGRVATRGSTRADYTHAAVTEYGDASFSSRKDLAHDAAFRLGYGSAVVEIRIIDAKTYRAIKAAKGKIDLDAQAPAAEPAQAEPVAQVSADVLPPIEEITGEAPAQAEPAAEPSSTVETVRAASPTAEIYGALQTAFDWFNARLFGAALPACLVTLQRKDHRVMGYYSPNRFTAPGGETVDEIAMNPAHFGAVPETLSTLAHEMAHLWQEHCGKPSRAGYHNEEWATKMDAIGLAPRSSDGKGKRTGQKMTHEIVNGGAFDVACRELLADPAFVLRWREVAAALGEKTKAKPTRAKFSCPDCGANAWAKPAAKLICGECEIRMVCDDPEAGEGEED